MQQLAGILNEALDRNMRYKEVPNPNAGKWRIVNADNNSPLDGNFYDTEEEAKTAADNARKAAIAAATAARDAALKAIAALPAKPVKPTLGAKPEKAAKPTA